MTKHELKDGKWYLVTQGDDDYCFSLYREDDDRFTEHEAEFSRRVNERTEWVEIDPEYLFGLLANSCCPKHVCYGACRGDVT